MFNLAISFMQFRQKCGRTHCCWICEWTNIIFAWKHAGKTENVKAALWNIKTKVLTPIFFKQMLIKSIVCTEHWVCRISITTIKSKQEKLFKLSKLPICQSYFFSVKFPHTNVICNHSVKDVLYNFTKNCRRNWSPCNLWLAPSVYSWGPNLKDYFNNFQFL